MNARSKPPSIPPTSEHPTIQAQLAAELMGLLEGLRDDAGVVCCSLAGVVDMLENSRPGHQVLAAHLAALLRPAAAGAQVLEADLRTALNARVWAGRARALAVAGVAR